MMHAIQHNTVLAVLVATLLAAGCGHTVNYTIGTPDPTAPSTDLLITRSGAPDLEVFNRSGPSANKSANLGVPPATGNLQFSVLGTATDNESGIKDLKLHLTRTVCFVASGGTIAQAYSGTVTRKEASFSDPSQAPTQVSVGDTGIIDRSPPALATPTDDNLLVFINANQVRGVGVGVVTQWSLETVNFAGTTSFSDVITVFAGDVSCAPTPP